MGKRWFYDYSTENQDGKTIMQLDNFKNVEIDGIYDLNKFYNIKIIDFVF